MRRAFGAGDQGWLVVERLAGPLLYRTYIFRYMWPQRAPIVDTDNLRCQGENVMKATKAKSADCVTKTAILKLRIEAALKQAAEKAARADRRTLSNFVEKLLEDKLREIGYLPKPGEKKPK